MFKKNGNDSYDKKNIDNKFDKFGEDLSNFTKHISGEDYYDKFDEFGENLLNFTKYIYGEDNNDKIDEYSEDLSDFTKHITGEDNNDIIDEYIEDLSEITTQLINTNDISSKDLESNNLCFPNNEDPNIITFISDHNHILSLNLKDINILYINISEASNVTNIEPCNNIENRYRELIDYIKENNYDIIIFQEVVTLFNLLDLEKFGYILLKYIHYEFSYFKKIYPIYIITIIKKDIYDEYLKNNNKNINIEINNRCILNFFENKLYIYNLKNPCGEKKKNYNNFIDIINNLLIKIKNIYKLFLLERNSDNSIFKENNIIKFIIGGDFNIKEKNYKYYNKIKIILEKILLLFNNNNYNFKNIKTDYLFYLEINKDNIENIDLIIENNNICKYKNIFEILNNKDKINKKICYIKIKKNEKLLDNKVIPEDMFLLKKQSISFLNEWKINIDNFRKQSISQKFENKYKKYKIKYLLLKNN